MFNPYDRPFPPFAWAHGDAPGGDRADDERPERRRRGPGGPRGPRWMAMAGGPRGMGGPGGPGGHGRRGGPFGPPFGPGFGGPGGPFGGRGGRGGRARRGDIRLAVLRLLAEQPMHGYQIIQELGARTGGVWNPSPGSVYPTLAALEDQGLVRAEESEGKRVFHLTDEGRRRLAEEADRPAPWDEVAAGTGGLADLRDVAIGVAEAARQVGSAGTPGQVERAVGLLKETRRKLYQILAEDPE